MFNYKHLTHTPIDRPSHAQQRRRIRCLTCLGVILLTLPVCGAEPAANATAANDTKTELSSVTGPAALVERDGQWLQPVRLVIHHSGDPVAAEIRLGDKLKQAIELQSGAQQRELLLPAVDTEQTVQVDLIVDAQPVSSQQVVLRPVRRLTVYIVPHSHTDIGYTEIQTDIETKQVNNLLQGIEYARKTADYPEGARFVWNVEVLWAADLYLQRLNESQRAEFFQAVQRGQVTLEGMYLNELTGLCRPEELVRLFRYGTQLARECGVTIDSAMVSDVPGYTWGTVTAMAHAGIKYFSVAPNYFDRIGDILVQWENKPFYWVGPSGQDRVLVWIPYRGYAMSHIIKQLTPEFVDDYQRQLRDTGYPFDIAYMRWAGHGDNAVPDPTICDFVRDWSQKYAWPKFVITSTSRAFREFEARYGSQLPEVRGDWTPYWEDGAGSSAIETGMNRASSDRLEQAEALWALADPTSYPVPPFTEAWNKVLLYSEHTWGAWCSVSEPERKETHEQWEIKRSYAEQADKQSRELLARALTASATAQGAPAGDRGAIDLYNTSSWARTELVRVPADWSAAGDRVVDSQGRAVPSQRLSNGELAFVATDVPPLAASRYRITAGAPAALDPVRVTPTTLDNGRLRLRIDEKTGGIDQLFLSGLDANLAAGSEHHRLNEYLYLIGDQLDDLQGSGPAKITIQEQGPLVACLRIESDAPGCRRLTRDVQLVAGFDRIELHNRVDKQRLVADDYRAATGKESVNFAFPFGVPDGQVRLHIPFAVMRPETDQIPSACKNWFTVGRWADVSNDDFGVTWVTLDAPLVQVGGITARLLNSQTNPDAWRKHVEPTQQLYCWAMNNHWGTNYRAYQEGMTDFRFILQPHTKYSAVDASQLAIGCSQPLLLQPAQGTTPRAAALRLQSERGQILITGLKPADDGKALIIRLWDASGEGGMATLAWPETQTRNLWFSDTSEQPIRKVEDNVSVPAWGLVTLRAEMP